GVFGGGAAWHADIGGAVELFELLDGLVERGVGFGVGEQVFEVFERGVVGTLVHAGGDRIAITNRHGGVEGGQQVVAVVVNEHSPADPEGDRFVGGFDEALHLGEAQTGLDDHGLEPG